MKLLTSITTIIAAASARQIYNHQTAENYANSAEVYQSALEHQQQGLYNGQSHAYTGHEAARQERPSAEKIARILNYVSENNEHGYQYTYETENGIKAQEASQTAEHGHATHGSYSYTGDDGHLYTVQYVADENGFRAEGAHLPTPPPIPEEILKSLEQNAKDEAAGINDDGNYKNQAYQVYQHVQQPYQQVQQQAHQQQYQAAEYQTGNYHQRSSPVQFAHGADLAYRGH